MKKKEKKVDLPGIELTAGGGFRSDARRSTNCATGLTHLFRVKTLNINILKLSRPTLYDLGGSADHLFNALLHSKYGFLIKKFSKMLLKAETV